MAIESSSGSTLYPRMIRCHCSCVLVSCVYPSRLCWLHHFVSSLARWICPSSAFWPRLSSSSSTGSQAEFVDPSMQVESQSRHHLGVLGAPLLLWVYPAHPPGSSAICNLNHDNHNNLFLPLLPVRPRDGQAQKLGGGAERRQIFLRTIF